jgi:hypothetical protein
MLMLVVVLLAACRGGTAETTVAASDLEPPQVVSGWLDALAGPDVAALEPLVEPVGLAVVAAVENDLRSDELVGLLTQGLSVDLATQYWTAFRDDFGAIHGEPISTVKVGELIPVPDRDDYVAVAIATATSSGQIVLRHTDTGWQIDFAATVGPALVGPLGEYLDSAISGEYASEIAAAYSQAIIPGLDAAAALDVDDTNLAFETEYLRQVVSGVS